MKKQIFKNQELKIFKDKMEELFYFYPKQHGVDPVCVKSVHIIGEFNKWGKDKNKLEEFKLTQDKVCRWVGLFKVPEGKHFYKFFINGQTVCPASGLLTYSTVCTPEWAKKAVWYQIMVDRFFRGDLSRNVPDLIDWDAPPDYFNNFGGDLQGIKEKIGYFKNLFGSLKNKAFYLNPIHKSLASNHKYWPEDFEVIDPQFGDEKDLKELIEVLHKENSRIIIDLVYNHTGLNHYAFLDILKNGSKSIYCDWYRGLTRTHGGKIEIPILENYVGDKPQNIEFENDPRIPEFDAKKESFISVWGGKYKFPIIEPEKFRNSSTEELLNHQPHYKLISLYNNPSYKCWMNLFEIPELKTKNPEVKKHLFNAAKKLIRLGVDGFRLDVPDLLEDAHSFWQEFRQEMKSETAAIGKNPDDLYIVGEMWTLDGINPSFVCAGDDGKPLRYDALMNYPVRENILNFFSGEILNKGADSVCRHGEISAGELDKNLHENLSGVSWGTSQVQFNVFSSHDTRRLRTVLKNDRKFKAALLMQFTLPGMPVIYYGDEIGMNGGIDPANRAAMKWNLYDELLQNKEESEIFNLHKNLIELRKNYDCLVNSPLLTLKIHNHDKVYSYARYKNSSDCAIVVVVKNNLKENLHLDISNMPFENIEGWKDPISSKNYLNYGKNITLKPEDFSDSFGIILVPEL